MLSSDGEEASNHTDLMGVYRMVGSLSNRPVYKQVMTLTDQGDINEVCVRRAASATCTTC